MKPPKGHIYVNVRAYLGVDIPGVIEVPIYEIVEWIEEKNNAKTRE